MFVCTGNICRSPAAEVLMRSRVEGLPITCSSAGTHGLSGYPMDAPSAQALRELGEDPSTHIARRLTGELIAAADLLLTADPGQRSIIVQSEPLAFRRTFTMREFARLGAGLDPIDGPPTPDVLRARVAEVAGRRGLVDPALPGEDEIGDPLGAGPDVARHTVRAISDTIDGVIAALGLPTVGVR